MSGETTMYRLKPIVSLPDTLYHSKTMYEMRNIHEESRSDDHTSNEGNVATDISDQSQRKLPDFMALEARQERILAQLAELKIQVSTLRGVLKQAGPSTLGASLKPQEPLNVNLVVNVNPRRPPYSLLALRKVWKDTEIKIKSYVHSSVMGTVPIEYTQQDCCISSKPNIINLSLIWKEVNDLELTIGLRGYCIMGESNFLRYLSRLTHSHNYEKSPPPKEANTTDLILDLCHLLHFEDSPKKCQEIISTMCGKLNSSQLSEGKPSIADIAAWSTVKQVFPKNIPCTLSKWFCLGEALFI